MFKLFWFRWPLYKTRGPPRYIFLPRLIVHGPLLVCFKSSGIHFFVWFSNSPSQRKFLILKQNFRCFPFAYSYSRLFLFFSLLFVDISQTQLLFLSLEMDVTTTTTTTRRLFISLNYSNIYVLNVKI
jgi:hypothetical protein